MKRRTPVRDAGDVPPVELMVFRPDTDDPWLWQSRFEAWCTARDVWAAAHCGVAGEVFPIGADTIPDAPFDYDGM